MRSDPLPRAKGHFDRINAAVYEMLTECDSYTREEVLRQAEKWNVCPHEFQFDVASVGGRRDLRLQLCV